MQKCLKVLLILALVWPATGVAQTQDPEKQVTRIYFEARKLIRANKLADALTKLEGALAVSHTPNENILFDLIKLAGETRNCRKLVPFAQSFMQIAPGDPEANSVDAKLKRCLKAMRDLGTISIESTEPKAVEIWMNHMVMGRTPIHNLRLPPGEYQISATDALHEPYQTTVRISPKGSVNHRFRMRQRRFKGNLEVVVKPAEGAVIYLNEHKVGKSPFKRIDLVTRKYLVRVEKPGWDRWIRYVRVERGRTTRVDVKLEKTGTTVPIPPIPRAQD